jgi:hypothetical protein
MDPRIIFSRDYKLQLQVKRRVTPLSHPIPIRIHYQALPGSYTLTLTTLDAHLYLASFDPMQSHSVLAG